VVIVIKEAVEVIIEVVTELIKVVKVVIVKKEAVEVVIEVVTVVIEVI